MDNLIFYEIVQMCLLVGISSELPSLRNLQKFMFSVHLQKGHLESLNTNQSFGSPVTFSTSIDHLGLKG